VSAAPIGTTIAGKVIAALPYALAVLLAITAISLVLTGPVLGVGAWLRLVLVLLFGSCRSRCSDSPSGSSPRRTPRWRSSTPCSYPW
jgi:ABC-2 type transport system permease protein